MNQPSRRLEDLHPTFGPRARQLLEKARVEGLELVVIQTLRPPEYQQWLWDSGRNRPGPIITRARPGQSAHEYGFAMDVVPTKFIQFPDWCPRASEWGQLGKLVVDLGLIWGGNFRAIKDRPHVELPHWRNKL